MTEILVLNLFLNVPSVISDFSDVSLSKLVKLLTATAITRLFACTCMQSHILCVDRWASLIPLSSNFNYRNQKQNTNEK